MAELDQNLLKEYKTLVKRADQRLVRLERAAQEPGFGKTLDWAYKSAMSDIRRWGGATATRYNVKTPMTNANLEQKIADVKRFLGMQTSTKSGIKAVYKKTADTYNQKYGTNFTAATFQKAWDSGIIQKAIEAYGSETGIKSLGEIQRNKNKVMNALAEADKKVTFAKGDTVIGQTINAILKDMGKDLLSLFK